MIITLTRDGTCADCGAHLPAGTTAKWYRNGSVYGLTCHPKRARTARSRGRDRTAYEQGDRSPGAIASHYDRTGVYSVDGERLGSLACGHEDYPCCGCGS